jgi:hypothetical protein
MEEKNKARLEQFKHGLNTLSRTDPISKNLRGAINYCGILRNELVDRYDLLINKIIQLPKKQAFKIICSWISCFTILMLLGYSFLGAYFNTAINSINQDIVKPVEIQQVQERKEFDGVGSTEGNQDVANRLYIHFGIMKAFIFIFDPLINGVLMFTPDVTGVNTGFDVGQDKVTTVNSKYDFGKVFGSAGKGISAGILFVGYLIFTLFFCLEIVAKFFYEALNLERDSWQNLMFRFFSTMMAFVAYPFIIAGLIDVINALNIVFVNVSIPGVAQFVSDNSKNVTGLMNGILDSIVNQYQKNPFEGTNIDINKPPWEWSISIDFNQLFKSVTETIEGQVNPLKNITNGIQATLIVVSMYLSLALLFLNLLTFVVRIFNILLLYICFPLVVPFHMKRDSEVVSNYWKELIGLLVHQPFFLLAFKALTLVIGLMVAYNFTSDFTGTIFMLLFLVAGFSMMLATNIISSRIWGNVFSAVVNSQIAQKGVDFMFKPLRGAVNTGFAVKSMIDKSPMKSPEQINNDFVKNVSQNTSQNPIKVPNVNTGNSYNNSGIKVPTKEQIVNNISSSSEIPVSNLTSKSNNTQLLDSTKSKQGQYLSNLGYNVTSQDDNNGVIGVEGKWFATDSSDGLTRLYTSKEDALANEKNESKIYEVQGKFGVLDTVNYNGMSRPQYFGQKFLFENLEFKVNSLIG